MFLGSIPLGSSDPHNLKKKKKQSDMSHKYQSHICQKNEMCVNLSNESLRKLIHKSIIENALHIIWTHKKQYNSYSF